MDSFTISKRTDWIKNIGVNKMKPKGQFTKIGKTEQRIYGPRGLLVCGYSKEERSDFLKFIEKSGPAGIQIAFASSLDLEKRVGDVLVKEEKAESAEESDMPRAVIMSGLTQNELHGLMAVYKQAGFKRQIWATLTPVSEKWPLEVLLKELQAEEKAMKDKARK